MTARHAYLVPAADAQRPSSTDQALVLFMPVNITVCYRLSWLDAKYPPIWSDPWARSWWLRRQQIRLICVDRDAVADPYMPMWVLSGKVQAHDVAF